MAKGVWRPRSERMPRDEYLARAYEFAHAKNAKLSDEIAHCIRTNRQGLTDQQQAELYGVHKNTIYKIRHHLAYARG
jgi:hypothetical protein